MTEHIWRCRLCPEFVPAYKLVNHIRLIHPDDYDSVVTWPDGGIVVEEDADEFFL